MSKFKVGDRVKCVAPIDKVFYETVGKTGTVIEISKVSDHVAVEFDEPCDGHSCGGLGKDKHCFWARPQDLEIITRTVINKINKTNMYQSFKNLFIKEPQKSYRAVGLTNDNDEPTQDGIKVVVSYLLNNSDFNEKFIADVVEPLKKAKEEESK